MANKVAIYVRVSTQYQVDRESLPVQRRELSAYSEYVLGINDYEIFEDAGYSAKNTDRPSFQQMMSRVRQHEFSHMLVWKIDRISRNLLDFAEMYAELKKLGVTFVSKHEQFDTSTAIGEAMLKIILVFAELERKMIGERVAAVMLSRASEGKYNGGTPPFGYTRDGTTIVVNEEERPTVERIYKLYLSGESTHSISKMLNNEGVSKRGATWCAQTVRAILRSPTYIGTMRYNVSDLEKSKIKPKEQWIIIEDHHEPIVSPETFNAVQEMLDNNRRGAHKLGDTYTSKYVNIFAGLIRCYYCGDNASAHTDHVRRKTGIRPCAYICARRRNAVGSCQNKSIMDSTLVPFIFTLVGNALRLRSSIPKNATIAYVKTKLLYDSFHEVMIADDIPDEDVVAISKMLKANLKKREYSPSILTGVHDERNALVEQKRKQETALERLHSLYLYGSSAMPEAQYIIEREAIQKEIEKIESQLKHIKEPPTNERLAESLSAMSDMLSNGIDYVKFVKTINPTIPKDFVNAIIDHIVAKDGKVESVVFKNSLTLHFIYKAP